MLFRSSFKKNRLEKGLDLNAPLCDIGKVKDALYRASKSEIISFTIETDETFTFSFNGWGTAPGSRTTRSTWTDESRGLGAPGGQGARRPLLREPLPVAHLTSRPAGRTPRCSTMCRTRLSVL